MKPTAIFLPALLLMFWTLTVLLQVPIRRVKAVMQQRLKRLGKRFATWQHSILAPGGIGAVLVGQIGARHL